MLTLIRERFGKVLVTLVIAAVGFVFVFLGVLSPRATRGLHEASVAGTVNGDAITLQEFNREYNRRLEFFRSMGGGKISEEQLKAFRIREGVFQELVRKKLMVQQAAKFELPIAADDIRERIMEFEAFKKDGHFDLLTYKQVLGANQLTPGSFEKLIKDDLSAQMMESYFRTHVRVSDEEIRRQFLINNEKRTLKYIVLTAETARAQMGGHSADPKQPAKSVSNDELNKANQVLLSQVMPLLEGAKIEENKVNNILKSVKTEIKTSGSINGTQTFLPGVGEAKEVLADAFSSKLGKPKKYQVGAQTVVAWVTESQSPDLANLTKQRQEIQRQIGFKKERDWSDRWMKHVTEKSAIDPNPSVINES